MSSKILSAAVIGLDAEIVEVEADLNSGDFGIFVIVGLPDTAVSESKERVRSAIKNSNLNFPKLKVTVNLAPADLKKQGPSYDLPIAISILSNVGLIKNVNFENILFTGELALSGDVRPISGILPIVFSAQKKGIKTIFIPYDNKEEASLVKNIEVIPVKSLEELVKHLKGEVIIQAQAQKEISFSNIKILNDMEHIKGQEHVKRAMEISATGGHNMLMSGPPGSGKTLIAKTMSSILPDLTLNEALDITKIYSVAGLTNQNKSLITSRPFRSPHHTASSSSLVGGGAWPRPGEISLSHRGVLFLDEFAEFPRHTLENLRQPLEDGIININRAAGSLTFPAKFILITAMNPCPCGYAGDGEKTCTCSPFEITRYNKKISGPILDRIDIHIEVPRVNFEKLNTKEKGESSKTIKERVEKARLIQKNRFTGKKYITNSEMSSEDVKKYCQVCNESRNLLKNAVDKMFLSARAYFRVLKLSRTIADLESSVSIELKHVAEALQYRQKS